MSTLRTTTNADLTSLGTTSSIGDTYFETDNNRIVVWDGTQWTAYNTDGVVLPFSNTSSVTMDGVDDYMTAPTDVLNFYNGGGTVSAWIRPTSVTATNTLGSRNRAIICKGNLYINFAINESGVPNLYFYDGFQQELTATSTVSTTDWMHICWTWSTSGCAIYVNGTSEASSTAITPANVSSTQTAGVVNLGKTLQSGADHFGGLLDELSLFDYELSSSQVGDLYISASGSNNIPADVSGLNPVNWWRMGDYSGDTSTVTDEGTKGTTRSDLTFQNETAFSSTVPLT